MPGGPNRWRLELGLVCAGALALRVGYVLALEHPFAIAADAYHYHQGANLLVEGKGFIVPVTYEQLGQVRQTAQHPPLYTVALAIPSLLGRRSVLDHQLWSCVIGTGTVALTGLVGRRLAGAGAGLVAAALAAVYPNLWLFDGLVASETLSLFTAALTLLAAYRLWERRSARTAVELGVACALAALTRAEALAYLPFVVVPLTLLRRPLRLRQRLTLAAVAALAAAATLAPFVALNLARFNNPILVASSFDLALVQGNCDDVYYGPDVGYYSLACIPPVPEPRGDETDDARYFRRVALDYVEANLDRLPLVALARLGRTFGLYDANRQIELDAFFESRDFTFARLGLGMYYALVATSVLGAVVLRRRRVPLAPLLGMVATVAVAVALTFGQTRYRVSAELVPVLLSAVALDFLRRRRRLLPGQDVVLAAEGKAGEAGLDEPQRGQRAREVEEEAGRANL